MSKIELKSGYATGYLPEGIGYKNYTMLVALANYSTNHVVAAEARVLLDEDNDIVTKERLASMAGGFFTKVCFRTFADAWNHADGSNRAALLTALSNNELEL